MNNKALTLSLVMAALALFFVQSYVTSVEEEQKKKFGTEVSAIVAKRDIKEMETLKENMLEFQIFPKRFLDPAAIAFSKKDPDEKETSKAFRDLTGAVAIVPIKKGEQITFNKLADPSIRTGLAPQIAPGRRAVAVPVSEVSGIAKLVKPGDRVDLIAVMDTGGGKESKLAKTILQDVIVLSIGRYITNNVARTIESDPYGTGNNKIRSLAEDFSFSSVTLEVEPAQAQTLALILASGENGIILSLRNNDDSERVPLSSSILADILGSDASRVKRK